MDSQQDAGFWGKMRRIRALPLKKRQRAVLEALHFVGDNGRDPDPVVWKDQRELAVVAGVAVSTFKLGLAELTREHFVGKVRRGWGETNVLQINWGEIAKLEAGLRGQKIEREHQPSLFEEQEEGVLHLCEVRVSDSKKSDYRTSLGPSFGPRKSDYRTSLDSTPLIPQEHPPLSVSERHSGGSSADEAARGPDVAREMVIAFYEQTPGGVPTPGIVAKDVAAVRARLDRGIEPEVIRQALIRARPAMAQAGRAYLHGATIQLDGEIAQAAAAIAKAHRRRADEAADHQRRAAERSADQAARARRQIFESRWARLPPPEQQAIEHSARQRIGLREGFAVPWVSLAEEMESSP